MSDSVEFIDTQLANMRRWDRRDTASAASVIDVLHGIKLRIVQERTRSKQRPSTSDGYLRKVFDEAEQRAVVEDGAFGRRAIWDAAFDWTESNR